MSTIIITAIIVGYAIFTLYRYVKKTKKGKCAGCSLSKDCNTGCSVTTPDWLEKK
ncbi:MAG: FeoB-associated Cys-rich membrane protein [Bacilli bacterium]